MLELTSRVVLSYVVLSYVSYVAKRVHDFFTPLRNHPVSIG